jgi:hypothetical protein
MVAGAEAMAVDGKIKSAGGKTWSADGKTEVRA